CGMMSQPQWRRSRWKAARWAERGWRRARLWPTGKEMSKKSGVSKVVRKSAAEIPPASQADLDRLRTAMQNRIDLSEIPERRAHLRLLRRVLGRSAINYRARPHRGH